MRGQHAKQNNVSRRFAKINGILWLILPLCLMETIVEKPPIHIKKRKSEGKKRARKCPMSWIEKKILNEGWETIRGPRREITKVWYLHNSFHRTLHYWNLYFPAWVWQCYAPFLYSLPKPEPCLIALFTALSYLRSLFFLFRVHNCFNLVLAWETPELLTTLSASPTCLLVLTSRGVCKRDRIAARCIMVNPSVVLLSRSLIVIEAVRSWMRAGWDAGRHRYHIWVA